MIPVKATSIESVELRDGAVNVRFPGTKVACLLGKVAEEMRVGSE